MKLYFKILILGALCPSLFFADSKKSELKEQFPIAPMEDLMREHGALDRMMLIYEEIVRRLETGDCIHIPVITKVAQLIRSFIEDYHEKIEEEYLFPEFKKADVLTDLTCTLKIQHDLGRTITQKIIDSSMAMKQCMVQDRLELINAIKSFIRMYRPHESWENTVLFPAFHTVVSLERYKELEEIFERTEHEKFGKEGFEGILKQIEQYEKIVGIYNLDQFNTVVSQETMAELVGLGDTVLYQGYCIRFS